MHRSLFSTPPSKRSCANDGSSGRALNRLLCASLRHHPFVDTSGSPGRISRRTIIASTNLGTGLRRPKITLTRKRNFTISVRLPARVHILIRTAVRYDPEITPTSDTLLWFFIGLAIQTRRGSRPFRSDTQQEVFSSSQLQCGIVSY